MTLLLLSFHFYYFQQLRILKDILHSLRSFTRSWLSNVVQHICSSFRTVWNIFHPSVGLLQYFRLIHFFFFVSATLPFLPTIINPLQKIPSLSWAEVPPPNPATLCLPTAVLESRSANDPPTLVFSLLFYSTAAHPHRHPKLSELLLNIPAPLSRLSRSFSTQASGRSSLLICFLSSFFFQPKFSFIEQKFASILHPSTLACTCPQAVDRHPSQTFAAATHRTTRIKKHPQYHLFIFTSFSSNMSISPEGSRQAGQHANFLPSRVFNPLPLSSSFLSLSFTPYLSNTSSTSLHNSFHWLFVSVCVTNIQLLLSSVSSYFFVRVKVVLVSFNGPFRLD